MVQAILSYVVKAIDEASSVMDKVKASVGILGSTLGELGGAFGSVGSIMTGFAGAGVVGAASAGIGELVKGLQWSVSEAAASETAVKNLSVAVEKSGTAWDTVSGKTGEFLSQMQGVTVYSDEQLAGALQRLLTFGMSYDEAMKALSTTVDLAAAKQMDLESAAGVVGKAFMGNTAILQRYGIDITTSKEATAAMKEAVDSIAGALKTAGADALAPFADVLGEAGVALTDSEGKTRKLKDVASELIGAFQSGTIDGEAFSQIMGALGTSIDTTKLKAADFPGVMSALNEQFGGTAQEQAKTYAGIQERFKNAVSDLGEKVGGILLPALSGMTEAMIPVADSFGKGVDAVQAWITEVGKMPEVKGFVDAAGAALEGFWKYLEDVGKFIQDTFGPVLQELWAAFKDLWEALSPIGEAFSEILSIFGEGTGGIDLLKAAVMAIAFEIKGFAEIIKAIAPYIRQFAEAFKVAADFIAPILGQLKDAIGGFIDWLKDTFQGFYNWLVGGSLWMDMWNQLLSVASELVGKILGDLGSKLFEPLKNAFTGAMQAVEDLWNKGWQAVQTGAQTVWDLIVGAVSPWIDGVKGAITSAMDGLKGDWGKAWDDAQAAAKTVWDALGSAASPWIEGIKTSIGTTMDGLKTAWDTSWDAIMTGAGTIWDTIKTNVGMWIDGVETTVSTTLDSIKTTWETGWQAAQTTFGTVSERIKTGVTDFLDAAKTTVSTGLDSIKTNWDMSWNAVQTTFSTITSQIQTELNTKFEDMKSFVQTNLGEYAPIANDALTAMQSAMNAVMALVRGDWQGFLDNMNLAMTSFWSAIQGATSLAFAMLQSSFTNSMNAIRGILDGAVSAMQAGWAAFMGFMQQGLGSLQGALSTAQSYVSSAVSAMEGVVSSALSYIQGAISSAWSQVTTATKDMADSLVKHSIWTEMLDQMQSQTEAALGNIVGEFQGAFENVTVSAPRLTRGATEGTAPAITAMGPQSITIPITVTLDGQPLVRIVKKVLIEQRQYHERSVGRLT